MSRSMSALPVLGGVRVELTKMDAAIHRKAEQARQNAPNEWQSSFFKDLHLAGQSHRPSVAREISTDGPTHQRGEKGYECKSKLLLLLNRTWCFAEKRPCSKFVLVTKRRIS